MLFNWIFLFLFLGSHLNARPSPSTDGYESVGDSDGPMERARSPLNLNDFLKEIRAKKLKIETEFTKRIQTTNGITDANLRTLAQNAVIDQKKADFSALKVKLYQGLRVSDWKLRGQGLLQRFHQLLAYLKLND